MDPIHSFRQTVRQAPAKLAVICGEQRLTFSEFAKRCEQHALRLAGSGIQPGDQVSFSSFNSLDLYEGYWAPALIGAVPVFLHPRLNAAVPESEDVAAGAVFFTSGTQGEPKPVSLSVENLYLHAVRLAEVTSRREDAIELQVIGLFHANGWGRPHMSMLRGNTVVLLPRFDADKMLRLIVDEHVTDTAIVPTMAYDLLTAAGSRFESRLREIHLGGAPVQPDLKANLERTFGCIVSEGYGMTEANSAIAYNGRLLPGLEIRFGDGGEMLLRGDTVAASAVAEDGWLHTGDIGHLDSNRRLRVIGRSKDMIISGGENIWVSEVESAINSHPAVVESAVIGKMDKRLGEVPHAFVVARKGEVIDASQLTRYLGARLPTFKLPREMNFVGGPLPRTPSGKIAKSALHDLR